MSFISCSSRAPSNPIAAGERIINAGDIGHCMYVILRGSVRVTVKTR